MWNQAPPSAGQDVISGCIRVRSHQFFSRKRLSELRQFLTCWWCQFGSELCWGPDSCHVWHHLLFRSHTTKEPMEGFQSLLGHSRTACYLLMTKPTTNVLLLSHLTLTRAAVFSYRTVFRKEGFANCLFSFHHRSDTHQELLVDSKHLATNPPTTVKPGARCATVRVVICLRNYE